jgi:NAD(P)-dependent dehydrogenase (short-subunit alcohol dehydrogenase family)
MPAVLITSANRGLGLEFAAQYLSADWQVYAACRQPQAADKLQQLARKRPDQIGILAMDVTDAGSVAAAAKSLQDASIDLLINSAGIIGAPGQRVGHIDYSSFAEVLDVNTLGPMRVTEAFIEQLSRGERKLLVTITSGMGSIADNTSGGSIPYRCSKAAVNMAMRCAAIDLRSRGISCVVVNPGWVKTDMGGPNATLSAQASVSAMRRLIDKLGLEQSGKFFNHDGREYPW